MKSLSNITVQGVTYSLADFHTILNGTGTAATSTSAAKWYATDTGIITEDYTKLTIAYKVPTNTTAGTVGILLYLNTTDDSKAKPICYLDDDDVPGTVVAGRIVLLTYDPNRNKQYTLNGTQVTSSGAWILAGFDTNTNTHNAHALNVTNGTASSVSQGTEITFVESVSGCNATTGNLSASTTRKKITVPAIPASLPASDVYSWAKQPNKPSYAFSEITGTISASQLPSYVDDVIELLTLSSAAPTSCAKDDKYYNTSSKKIFTATATNTWGTTGTTPEKGKIYVSLSNSKTYRWSGSDMAVISETLALGETSSTAYRGDRGKTAYDHSQSTHARTDATKTEASSTNGNIKINGTEVTVYTHPSGTNPHGTTKSDVGLGNVENKSSATIRGELTSSNVTTALGFTPATSGHTHTTSIATSTGTNQITLAYGTKYVINAGGTSYVFTTPSLGTSATTACAGNDSRLSDSRTPKSHTHGNITNDGKIGSTASLPLITTTGGTITTGSFGNSAGTFCQGNDSRLSDSRPASDVYSWAKASTKPSYNFNEIGNRYDTLLGFSSSAPGVSGNVSAIGMAISPEHGANRLAFLNPAAIELEYATDGTNYTALPFSDANKKALVTLSASLPVGRATGEYYVGSKTRLTLTALNSSGTTYLYCSPKKMLINISSSGGMEVLIETRTGNNMKSSGAWTTYGTYTLSGWSGWNEIPLVLGTLGGSNGQWSNNAQLRLTFTMTSKSESYPTSASINSIRLFADNIWTSPSTMASTGHLYSYSTDQSATFPDKIYSYGLPHVTSGSRSNSYLWNTNGTYTNLTWDNISSKPTSMPASDVYSWAKASTKPSYTLDEVSDGTSRKIPTKVSQLTNDSGYTTNTGTVTSVKVGSTSYNPSSGVVSLPAYPTTLPASDVYSWAKASTKPSYSWTEISGRPTNVSSFTNDSGYITSSSVGNGTLSLKTNGTTTVTTFSANQSSNSSLNFINSNNIITSVSSGGNISFSVRGYYPGGGETFGFALKNNSTDSISADGQGSLAFGKDTEDSGLHEIKANGEGSLAGGYVGDDGKIIASGDGSIAFGKNRYNIGIRSEGIASVCFSDGESTANGTNSFIAGKHCWTGNHSAAFGRNNIAGGEGTVDDMGNIVDMYTCAFSAGKYNKSKGNFATTFGHHSAATESCAFAEGHNTLASGKYSHAEGCNCSATAQSAHAEGYNNTAEGKGAHAEGNNSTADGKVAHAEGSSWAKGDFSHSEGLNSSAKSFGSHSENKSEANGPFSHAEGYHAATYSIASHAEGHLTNAVGRSSHAEGEGDPTLISSVKLTGSANTQTYTVNTVDSLEVNNVIVWVNPDNYGNEHPNYTDGVFTKFGIVVGISGNSVTLDRTINPDIAFNSSECFVLSSGAFGDFSHAEGKRTKAFGVAAHTEGYDTSTYANYAHAEGNNTKAISDSSHAEGTGTIAYGDYSHTEGENTIAYGTSSHAEGSFQSVIGCNCTKSGKVFTRTDNTDLRNAIVGYAVVWKYNNQVYIDKVASSTQTTITLENNNTAMSGTIWIEVYAGVAWGNGSHVGGYNNVATSDYQTVIGKNSIIDKNGEYAFMIGNGSAHNNRSNIFGIKWNGDIINKNYEVIQNNTYSIHRDSSFPTTIELYGGNFSNTFYATSGDIKLNRCNNISGTTFDITLFGTTTMDWGDFMNDINGYPLAGGTVVQFGGYIDYEKDSITLPSSGDMFYGSIETRRRNSWEPTSGDQEMLILIKMYGALNINTIEEYKSALSRSDLIFSLYIY